MKTRFFLLVLFSIFTIDGVFGQVVNPMSHPSADGPISQCLILDQKIWMGVNLSSSIFHYSGSSWNENHECRLVSMSGVKSSNGENVIYLIDPTLYLHRWDNNLNRWNSIPNKPDSLLGYAPILRVVDEANIYILPNYCCDNPARLYRYNGSEFIELFVDTSNLFESFLYADTEKIIFSRFPNFSPSGILSCYYLEQDTIVDLVTIPGTPVRIRTIRSINGEDFFILTQNKTLYQYNINTQILKRLVVFHEDDIYTTLEVASDNCTVFIGSKKGITKVQISNKGEVNYQRIYSISDFTFFIESSSCHGDKMIFAGFMETYNENGEAISFFITLNYTTGVIETTLPDINIFPNPSADWIKIDGLKETSHIQIFDIAGKLVLSQECQIEETINISDLNAGMYIMHVQNSEGVFSTKLVKE